jgi:hypothetical protein
MKASIRTFQGYDQVGERLVLRRYATAIALMKPSYHDRLLRLGAGKMAQAELSGVIDVPFFRSGKEMKFLLNSDAHGSDTDTGRL